MTRRVPVKIPLQASGTPAFDRAFSVAVGTGVVGLGGPEQSVYLGVDLPNKMICQVFFEITRKMGQRQFKRFEVWAFHGGLQGKTGYKVVYSVFL